MCPGHLSSCKALLRGLCTAGESLAHERPFGFAAKPYTEPQKQLHADHGPASCG